MGYGWFFEEGVGDVIDNGDDVIDNDNDGGNGANFDKVCDVADMLDDVLGLGECWRSSLSVLVLILTLVSTGRGCRICLASKIPFYLL